MILQNRLFKHKLPRTMNKNFIKTNFAVVGVLIGGSLISSSDANNSQLDYYIDNFCVSSKSYIPKKYITTQPIKPESNISTITPLSSITDDQDMILREFVGSIIKHSKPLDSDFSALIDDNFWDLV